MERVNNQDVLYARGFLIAPVGASDPPSWFRSLEVDGWQISYEQRTAVFVAQGAPGHFVCIIGHAIDVVEKCDSGAAIAKCLLALLEKSELAFFDALDSLAGRYAVFYGNGSNASILGDACAVRTIFYSRSKPLVASHFDILAKRCGTAPTAHAKLRKLQPARRKVFGYPAGTTPDENIGLLMANMVLRFDGMAYERYYPRRELREAGVEEAAGALLDMFDVQLELLSRRYDFVCSLTAGLDSRTSLAVLRPYLARSRFFSYSTQEREQVDAKMAAFISESFGLNYQLMSREDLESPDFKKFKSLLVRNSYHSHKHEAAYGYKRVFQSGDIHLRSNLYEVARAFYRAMRDRPDDLSAADMASLYFRDYTADDVDILAAFSKYIDSSRFDRGIFNYDPYDLFYWEQRMSCWHALVVLEADPAVDTWLLMNCRRCIESGLSVPIGDRVKSSVFKKIIEWRWPELLKLPVNPKVFDGNAF